MRRRQRFTVFLNLLGETPLLARLQLYLPLHQNFVGLPPLSNHILHARATVALGHGRNALLLLQSGAVEEMRCRTRRTDLAGRRNRRAKRDSTNTPLTPWYLYSVADELPQMPFLNTKYFLKKFMKCYNFLLFGNSLRKKIELKLNRLAILLHKKTFGFWILYQYGGIHGRDTDLTPGGSRPNN
jgi:hypothetical protein